MERCLVCVVFFRRAKRYMTSLLYPHDGADKKVIETMEKMAFLKTEVSIIIKIGINAFIWISGSANYENAWTFLSRQADESVNKEFISSSLPVLKYTILSCQILYIPLALLYLKYPQITKIFFILEIIINMQDAFVAYTERNIQMQIVYYYLIFNYVIISCFNFMISFSAVLVYISVYIYAQTIVYKDDSQ